MKIIEQNFEWVKKPDDCLKIIEFAGRTCYKSEDKIGEGTDAVFTEKLIANHHDPVIEFGTDLVIKITTSRSVTHELVRHRHCSFAQLSQRYVTYKNSDIEFIQPVWWNESRETQKQLFIESCQTSEQIYNDLVRCGWRAEQAREVLPNSVSTEILVKANPRQWRHILNMRCSSKAHPQIRDIMTSILMEFYTVVPILFDDLAEKYLTPETITIAKEDRIK